VEEIYPINREQFKVRRHSESACVKDRSISSCPVSLVRLLSEFNKLAGDYLQLPAQGSGQSNVHDGVTWSRYARTVKLGSNVVLESRCEDPGSPLSSCQACQFVHDLCRPCSQLIFNVHRSLLCSARDRQEELVDAVCSRFYYQKLRSSKLQI